MASDESSKGIYRKSKRSQSFVAEMMRKNNGQSFGNSLKKSDLNSIMPGIDESVVIDLESQLEKSRETIVMAAQCGQALLNENRQIRDELEGIARDKESQFVEMEGIKEVLENEKQLRNELEDRLNELNSEYNRVLEENAMIKAHLETQERQMDLVNSDFKTLEREAEERQMNHEKEILGHSEKNMALMTDLERILKERNELEIQLENERQETTNERVPLSIQMQSSIVIESNTPIVSAGLGHHPRYPSMEFGSVIEESHSIHSKEDEKEFNETEIVMKIDDDKKMHEMSGMEAHESLCRFFKENGERMADENDEFDWIELVWNESKKKRVPVKWISGWVSLVCDCMEIDLEPSEMGLKESFEHIYDRLILMNQSDSSFVPLNGFLSKYIQSFLTVNLEWDEMDLHLSRSKSAGFDVSRMETVRMERDLRMVTEVTVHYLRPEEGSNGHGSKGTVCESFCGFFMSLCSKTGGRHETSSKSKSGSSSSTSSSNILSDHQFQDSLPSIELTLSEDDHPSPNQTDHENQPLFQSSV